MAVNDIYQAQIFYNIGSEITMNVVHWKEKVASTDDIPAKTVAKITRNRWNDIYSTAAFSDETRITAIAVRRIKPTAGVPFLMILGTAEFPVVQGTAAGNPLPAQAAVLVSLYTSVLTKSGRGRIYLPGLASGTQNDGQILEATLTLLEGDISPLEEDQVALAGDTGEWRLGVYSRKLLTIAEVSHVVVHSNMATQRGRRNFPGVGV